MGGLRQVWTAFVDSFVDTVHARGPAARPHREVHHSFNMPAGFLGVSVSQQAYASQLS